ncbi:butyrophilin-like protein 1 isoform X2 [Acanthopagrus latus]|uniref:butyrophilin-like protein 1 isoform X2 n=1 Tax=Acanthopagrus latus TaxID=8177 RepID=UPI00187BD597|nr:butyrophilin-like protein 1 isoform X2 [Acanthopagrus latus]
MTSRGSKFTGALQHNVKKEEAAAEDERASGARMGRASLMILILILHFVSVPAGPQEITVRPGEDVTLPCQASSGVVSLLVWRRTEPKTFKYVFHFRDGISSENFQEPSFRGRVELRDPEMKDGDGSVILKNVTASDSGTYECRVAEETAGRRKRDAPKLINTIHLGVKELGPTAGVQDDEGTAAPVASVTVLVVLAAGGILVAAAATGLIIYKKKCPAATGHGS